MAASEDVRSALEQFRQSYESSGDAVGMYWANYLCEEAERKTDRQLVSVFPVIMKAVLPSDVYSRIVLSQ